MWFPSLSGAIGWVRGYTAATEVCKCDISAQLLSAAAAKAVVHWQLSLLICRQWPWDDCSCCKETKYRWSSLRCSRFIVSVAGFNHIETTENKLLYIRSVRCKGCSNLSCLVRIAEDALYPAADHIALPVSSVKHTAMTSGVFIR